MTAATKRVVVLFAAVVVVALPVVLLTGGKRDGVAQLMRVGAAEMPTPASAEAGWLEAMRCLGLTAPFDREIRWFVGSKLPKEWVASGEAGTMFGGYAHAREKLILLGPGYTKSVRLIVHEQMHVLIGDGHPPKYFDGRCVRKE